MGKSARSAKERGMKGSITRRHRGSKHSRLSSHGLEEEDSSSGPEAQLRGTRHQGSHGPEQQEQAVSQHNLSRSRRGANRSSAHAATGDRGLAGRERIVGSRMWGSSEQRQHRRDSKVRDGPQEMEDSNRAHQRGRRGRDPEDRRAKRAKGEDRVRDPEDSRRARRGRTHGSTTRRMQREAHRRRRQEEQYRREEQRAKRKGRRESSGSRKEGWKKYLTKRQRQEGSKRKEVAMRIRTWCSPGGCNQCDCAHWVAR